MRERGFLEEEIITAGDLVAKHLDTPLVTLYAEELVSHAIVKMRKFGISQIPVMKDGKFVGSIDDLNVYQVLVDNPELRDASISSVMQAPLPIVKSSTPVDEVCKLINKNSPAVLVELPHDKFHIVTRHDVIQSMS
jgi:cystathionine beta-synthase